jgi:hypothetical protein
MKNLFDLHDKLPDDYVRHRMLHISGGLKLVRVSTIILPAFLSSRMRKTAAASIVHSDFERSLAD